MFCVRSTSQQWRSILYNSRRMINGQSHTLLDRMDTLYNTQQYRKLLDLYARCGKQEFSEEFPKRTIQQLIHACGKSKDLSSAIHIHHLFSSRVSNDLHLLESFIIVYTQCGDMKTAETLFAQCNRKTLAMYGALMSGYTKSNQAQKSIKLFDEIENPNRIILTLLFNACAKIGSKEALDVVKRVSSTMPNSFNTDPFLITSWIDALMKCGDVSSAESLFNRIKSSNVSTYGAMMKGYIKNNQPQKAVDLFQKLEKPGDIRIILFFNACARLQNKQTLRLVKNLYPKLLLESTSNAQVINSLLDALIKCGDCQTAETILNQTSKNVITYGNLMNEYNNQNKPEQTLRLFNEMKTNLIEPNYVIYLVLLKALTRMSIGRLCEKIVPAIPKNILTESKIKTTLMAMWAKTGLIDRARMIFDNIDHPDTYDYATMIHGYGLHGMGSQALEIYHRTPSSSINEVSYLCILNACSHSGYVNEAQRIFDQIERKSFKIYTAMIDCLSRAAMFDQAQALVNEYERDHPPMYAMHMALLSGARNYKNHQLAEQIVIRMKELFPDLKNALISASILLANIYGSLGQIDEASNIRSQWKQSGTKKIVGMAWTAPDDKVFKFSAHDQSHPRSAEIYAELERMSHELIKHGHQYDSTYVTRALNEDETVESVLCGHSEKLAIAWNFVVNPETKKIEVTKNLRVCPDCHSATKLLAQIRQCEFIIRDANRIHHVTADGRCSCEEYF